MLHYRSFTLVYSTSKAYGVDMDRDDVGFFEMVEGFFDRAAGIMEDQLVSEVGLFMPQIHLGCLLHR